MPSSTTETPFARWAAIGLTVGCVVGLVIGAILSALQTPQYRSSTRVLFGVNPAIAAAGADVGLSLGERPARTELEFVRSRLVADEAEDRLGYLPAVEVALVEGADVIILTATDEDADRAQLAADTYADAYLAVRQPVDIAQQLITAEAVLGHIATLETRILDAATEGEAARLQELRDSVFESYNQLILAAEVGAAERAQVIDPAERPESPSEPRTARNIVGFAMAAALVGLGVSFIGHRRAAPMPTPTPAPAESQRPPGSLGAAVRVVEAPPSTAPSERVDTAVSVDEFKPLVGRAAQKSAAPKVRTGTPEVSLVGDERARELKSTGEVGKVGSRPRPRRSEPSVVDGQTSILVRTDSDIAIDASATQQAPSEMREPSSLNSPFERLRLQVEEPVPPDPDPLLENPTEPTERADSTTGTEPTPQFWGDQVVFR